MPGCWTCIECAQRQGASIDGQAVSAGRGWCAAGRHRAARVHWSPTGRNSPASAQSEPASATPEQGRLSAFLTALS